VDAGHIGFDGAIPDVESLRIPVKYLANLLTAGDTFPVERALERMLAMRAYQRGKACRWPASTLKALQQVHMKPGRCRRDVPGDGDCQL
jgi:nitrate reductase beta subunit